MEGRNEASLASKRGFGRPELVPELVLQMGAIVVSLGLDKTRANLGGSVNTGELFSVELLDHVEQWHRHRLWTMDK